MHDLHVDIETFSSVSISDSGAHKYVLSPDFEIMLFAYAVDHGTVQIIDIASGEKVPEWIIAALKDPNYIKHAHNATFEFLCLSKYYGALIPSQWRCSMIHSLYCGYPAKLEVVGAALNLPEDKKKLNTGKALIRYFCVPCKPTKVNGGRTRNYFYHDPDKWALFKKYCLQDVVTEMEIERRLAAFPLPEFVQKQWETDLTINIRGVAVDMEFVGGALAIGGQVKNDLMEEARNLTGLRNPNSITQLLEWLRNRVQPPPDDLKKETVSKLLERNDLPTEARRALEIRQELGKTSTKTWRLNVFKTHGKNL